MAMVTRRPLALCCWLLPREERKFDARRLSGLPVVRAVRLEQRGHATGRARRNDNPGHGDLRADGRWVVPGGVPRGWLARRRRQLLRVGEYLLRNCRHPPFRAWPLLQLPG